MRYYLVILSILLTGCESIPPDELEIDGQDLKNRCEIQCFPKAVRWNYITHKCVCLKKDAE